MAQRKSLQIGKFITAEERPELDGLIRVRPAIIVVRIPGTIHIETELQRLFANYVVNPSDREYCLSKTLPTEKEALPRMKAAGLSNINVGMFGANPVDVEISLSCELPA